MRPTFNLVVIIIEKVQKKKKQTKKTKKTKKKKTLGRSCNKQGQGLHFASNENIRHLNLTSHAAMIVALLSLRGDTMTSAKRPAAVCCR